MSEFSLIHTHFKHATAKHDSTILGISDDCAISHVPMGSELVSCMDTLVAGRHFVQEADPYAIGFKSVAVNLSDLAAMGATPYAILLGLSLPDSLANDGFLTRFAHGLGEICTRFGVELIGGDTTQSQTLTISITALGFVPQGAAIQRCGAKVGDVVCVSDQIGSASFALSQLLRGETSSLQAYLDLPQPQLVLGQALRGFASAMIDISDGLGQDLSHILNASGVGADIELDNIPCHELLDALPDAQKWQHIINGGDDYQLCFSISPDKFADFQKKYPHLPIYPIGKISKKAGLRFLENGQPIDFNIKGWEHF